MAEHSYIDLRKEVWERGTCAGCGACVAVCPADAICFDEPGGGLRPRNIGYCKKENDEVPCGACYDACPRTGVVIPEKWGNYREILSARATMEIPGKQAGGAVTAILSTLLEQGLIDGVVTVTADRLTLLPRSVVLTTAGKVRETAGSRYNWWVPLVAALKTAVIDMKLKKIAIVGVPCVIRAVHQIKASDNDLLKPFGTRIRLSVGLFCTETFDYRILVGDILEKRHNLKTTDIQRIDVRGKLEITTRKKEKIAFPMSDLKEAIRPGCHFCTDFTAIHSDISAGAVGSPRGYTTLIVRTGEGQFFLDEAMALGSLERGPDVDREAVDRLAAGKIDRARKI
ncbi:MAG: Coenzyme F420 hydrogenase/dehydrogenase, beta subunit C-terminal domain [Methanolinea sp.]|jgi:coenzyme F420 hydrogenase subunit beta|nr:Coenzyme F420 hydrogenase/dehydrogenase, beta subunit C-terminal domain [Methanolinea sp.]